MEHQDGHIEEYEEEIDGDDDPFIYASERFAIAPTEEGALEVFRIHGGDHEELHLHEVEPAERAEVIVELREFLHELDSSEAVGGPIPDPGPEQDELILSLLDRMAVLLPEEDEDES